MTAPADIPLPRLELPTLLRRASGHLPDGPHRDALLELAGELEAGGDPAPISHATVWAALKAFGSPELPPNSDFRFGAGDLSPPAEQPKYLRRAAFLRREADHHPDGPARDALLRYAEELEDKRDNSLVSNATIVAALKAFGSPDRLPDIDGAVAL